jgi:glutamine amidotransferase
MIGIIDYGAGNLLSVRKALDYFSFNCKIVKTKDEFSDIDKIILPGVGAFQTAVEKLRSSGLYKPLLEWVKNDKPFLGICLGMQLLFESSTEADIDTKGFGIFKGSVLKFKSHKVPQIGWNQVKIKNRSDIFKDIDNLSFFYFLHSYYVKTKDNNITIGLTNYSIEYTSVVQKGNIFGVQFHPEKSGDIGLNLLKNWVNLC